MKCQKALFVHFTHQLKCPHPREFVPWVPEVCLARFPVSVNVSIVNVSIVTRAKKSAEADIGRPSAGNSRSGPRETSGTQDREFAIQEKKNANARGLARGGGGGGRSWN